MVALETPSVQIGWKAPEFKLIGTDGEHYSPTNIVGENGLVIMFICNHCPFVKAISSKLTEDMNALLQIGVNSIAVMSNDADEYPEDSFDNMKLFKEKNSFPFPYVFDETQEVAKEYDAVCTPDFFGFDGNLELQYRGRLDSSGMNYTPDNERELYNAMKQVVETGSTTIQQNPSIGCSIKWRE